MLNYKLCRHAKPVNGSGAEKNNGQKGGMKTSPDYLGRVNASDRNWEMEEGLYLVRSKLGC